MAPCDITKGRSEKGSCWGNRTGIASHPKGSFWFTEEAEEASRRQKQSSCLNFTLRHQGLLIRAVWVNDGFLKNWANARRTASFHFGSLVAVTDDRCTLTIDRLWISRFIFHMTQNERDNGGLQGRICLVSVCFHEGRQLPPGGSGAAETQRAATQVEETMSDVVFFFFGFLLMTSSKRTRPAAAASCSWAPVFALFWWTQQRWESFHRNAGGKSLGGSFAQFMERLWNFDEKCCAVTTFVKCCIQISEQMLQNNNWSDNL